MKADLHMHSTYSDGRKTPEELFQAAKEVGLDYIAITDHDVISNVKENKELSKKYEVNYIPAIELSTLERGKPVHLLGYFTDESYDSVNMKDYFVDIKKRREDRTHKFITNLKTFFDIEITYEDVKEFSNGIIARPHIAKAINKKYPHYRHDYIFDHFIGDHSRAYVPSCELSVQEGIDLLRKNNCVVVLAHPTLLKNYIHDDVLEYDIDGIEAIYYQNKPGDEEKYREIAKERNLFVTAGSDHHGIPHDSKHGNVGELTLSGDDLEQFIMRVKK